MSKQKGFAVISGSSTVVAKIMENGTVAFGGVGPDNKPVDMSISGSLTFGGLSGSAGVTQGGEDKVLLVGPGGVATIGQLSASQINLGADSFTAPGQASVSGADTIVDALTKLSSSIEALSSSLGATTATVDADNASEQSFDLTDGGKLVIAGGSNLTSTVSKPADDVIVNIDLDSEVSGLTSVSATSLTASAGVETPKVKPASGDLTLDAGANTVKVLSALSSSGDFTTAGELTVNGPGESVFEGDLRVKGDLVVDGDTVTVNVTNLVVEDKVVLLGSGSTSATDDFGLVFGQNPSGASILAVEDGVFKLGTTTTVDGTGIGAVTAGGSLQLGTLTASTEVSGSTVKAGTLSASLAQIGDLTVTGQVNLPTGSIDNHELANSSITVTAGNGLINGGSVSLGGTVTLDLDLNELATKSSIVAADSIAIVDSEDSNESKKLSFANLVTASAAALEGTGLNSANGKLSIDFGSGADQVARGDTSLAISGSSGEIEVAINGGSFGASGSLILGAAGNSIQIGLPESVTIAQNLTVGGNAVVTGSLTVNGAATLGNAASDDIKVNGKFRIARMDRTEAETEFPVVSGSYPYNGYMFYLNDADDNNAAVFKQGQKWYFCEDGEWHASPFFSVE